MNCHIDAFIMNDLHAHDVYRIQRSLCHESLASLAAIYSWTFRHSLESYLIDVIVQIPYDLKNVNSLPRRFESAEL